MSNGKSGWPASGAFPFMPFPIPGLTPPAESGSMASGIDLLKTMWGSLPGSSQVPGFLVPTLDTEELDKRIGDLRAAESWVEVNLNMLRATIQGLEVQRNTIAALKSLSATPLPKVDAPSPSWAAPAPAPAVESPAPAAVEASQEQTPAATPGLAAGNWLAYMQDQFAKVAEAALSATGPAAASGKAGKGAPKAAAKPASKTRKRRVATR